MTTSLKFLGDLNPWLGILLASGLAAGAWFLYRRETRDRADRLRWLLPLCERRTPRAKPLPKASPAPL